MKYPALAALLLATTAPGAYSHDITSPVQSGATAAFDAVTAELQVNVNVEVPLLCMTGVHDVASGDLSLPGRVVIAD